MNFLYNTAIRAYKGGVKIASNKNIKASKMCVGQKQTLELLRNKIKENDKYIWIHAASLGEFEQGRPLIELIKKEKPNQKILLSFFSPSGYEVRKDYSGVDLVCYLPFDLPKNVKNFLDASHPIMAIFIKYEFWGNYLENLKKRNIPTFIISSIFRPNQIFFRGYGSIFRQMLKCYTKIYVQDSNSQNLLNGIGIKNVSVMGDTRFDRVLDIRSSCQEFPLLDQFVDHKLTLIMGSSWEPDEDIVLPFFNTHSELKLIIAPHELSEARIETIIKRIQRPIIRYSELTEDNASSAACIIIDCYGILASCYRYGNIAYIGGGFGVGIHNINEAAVYGVPVIFGPKYGKFKEAKDLLELKGGFSISSSEEFNQVMEHLIKDKSTLSHHGSIAGKYINDSIGATKKIFDEIKYLLQ